MNKEIASVQPTLLAMTGRGEEIASGSRPRNDKLSLCVYYRYQVYKQQIVSLLKKEVFIGAIPLPMQTKTFNFLPKTVIVFES